MPATPAPGSYTLQILADAASNAWSGRFGLISKRLGSAPTNFALGFQDGRPALEATDETGA